MWDVIFILLFPILHKILTIFAKFGNTFIFRKLKNRQNIECRHVLLHWFSSPFTGQYFQQVQGQVQFSLKKKLQGVPFAVFSIFGPKWTFSKMYLNQFYSMIRVVGCHFNTSFPNITWNIDNFRQIWKNIHFWKT